ncbi:MAG TPA: HepT-like ribonuclease domain-containing protein [Frateuria sp.]|uniref:HepT-like ribonuclease domain-containing protein n=1 Tax=Frateuria sp. TaxID=2211372 RepID=UPI002D7E6BA0|nr:HepT-like ribonuclease domain-containing protein [Frateuria sp.]HET6804187.1 HepT-like ribonuclease domain-containing protein [Frateuria sp.]
MLARHPTVDWRGWAGLRDIVSHQYFSLELPRLQPTIRDDLPALLAAVRSELDGS